MTTCFEAVREAKPQPGTEPETVSTSDLCEGSPYLQRIGAAVYRIEVVGADRFPAIGPVVVASNHESWLDGIIQLCWCQSVSSAQHGPSHVEQSDSHSCASSSVACRGQRVEEFGARNSFLVAIPGDTAPISEEEGISNEVSTQYV